MLELGRDMCPAPFKFLSCYVLLKTEADFFFFCVQQMQLGIHRAVWGLHFHEYMHICTHFLFSTIIL